MAYDYTGYQTALMELMGTNSVDLNFPVILPNIIDYAEQRIYREIDLLNTRQLVTATMTAGTRAVSVPGNMIVTESVNVITPASAVTPATGTRNQMVPVSPFVLDALWPTEGMTNAAVPTMFAMLTQSTIQVGPPPDQAYTVEFYGTFRPAPLSATNPTTLLTQQLPDLFLAASMVFASGYMKNYAAASSDDQSQPVNWETQYGKEMQSAMVEEFRKKFQGSGFSPEMPSAVANDKQRG